MCVLVSVDAVHVSLSYQTPITIWYDIRRYTCVHPDYMFACMKPKSNANLR